jgi:hypothetical protein
MGQMSWFGKLVHFIVDYVWEDLLRDFLQTWEELEDGRIQGQVRGQEIWIDFQGRNNNATNATFEEAKTTLKKIVGSHAFVENQQECNSHEGRISCQICNYFANSLPNIVVIVF